MAPLATVICVTPVKNEAWILDRFIRCASEWADKIIIADQGSTDGSIEIARRFPKVVLLNNASPEYSEHVRGNLLLAEARKTPGKRILIALDADEVLSANWRGSLEWEQILSAPEGTIIRFPKAELHYDQKTYWGAHGDAAGLIHGDSTHGLVDDGSEFTGSSMHGARLPKPEPHHILRPLTLWVLHYRYTDPVRTRSKIRWYHCWEALQRPRIRPITSFRHYAADLSMPEVRPSVRPEWFEGYSAIGIDMHEVNSSKHNWWDQEVISMLSTHGVDKFRRIDMWDDPWWLGMEGLASPNASGNRVNASNVWPYDPRNGFEKAVHRWLRKTQKRKLSPEIRLLQRLLIPLGW